MIRKTTRPTTTLPPTTNEPNAWITEPASPCSRISRVTETLMASRKSVVNSRSDGKIDSSSASCVYIEIRTSVSASARLIVIRMSSSTRRQRQHHHHDDHHDRERDQEVGVLQEPCRGCPGGRVLPIADGPQLRPSSARGGRCGRRRRGPRRRRRRTRPGSPGRPRPGGRGRGPAAGSRRSRCRARRRARGCAARAGRRPWRRRAGADTSLP